MAEIVPLELIHVECECAFGPLGIGSAIPVPLNSTIQTNAFGLGARSLFCRLQACLICGGASRYCLKANIAGEIPARMRADSITRDGTIVAGQDPSCA